MSYNTILYSHSPAFYIKNTADAILLNISKQLLDVADNEYIMECIEKTIDKMKDDFDGYIFYDIIAILNFMGHNLFMMILLHKQYL